MWLAGQERKISKRKEKNREFPLSVVGWRKGKKRRLRKERDRLVVARWAKID